MAEIFGVLAAVAGLADVGTRLSLLLRDVVRSWNDAPCEILALNNEVSDLITVLRFTENACQDAKNMSADCSFTSALEEHVRTARQLLGGIENVVALLTSTTGTKQKRKWIKLKQSIMAKKGQLKVIRLKIWDLLQVYQVLAGSKIQLELGLIQLALQDSACATSKGFHSMDQRMENISSNLAGMLESVTQNHTATQRLERTVSEMLKGLGYADTGFSGSLSPNPPASQATPAQRAKDQGTYSIWAVYRERTCSAACICACHTARSPRRGFRTPAFLRNLLGSLFATYTGVPQWGSTVACDTAMCHRQSSRTWEIEYQFPLWFANWNIHALMHIASTGGPTLGLVLRQRVQYRFDSIFRAVDSNNVDAIQAILQRNPDSVNYRVHRDGFTPLHYACLRPTKISFRVFQLLLRAGADLDAENDSGRSALSYVAGHMVLGAFPDAHTHEISRWVSMSRILDELELSPVAEVAVGLRVGNIMCMLRTLPPSKLKLTKFDNTGSTPLCWASKAGNLEAIRAIVEVGDVDINQPTSTGNTPLMCSFALKNHGGELIDWLLDNGADPVKQNRDGYNAFTLACYLGRFDVVQQLIQRGVDPDIRDGQGRTGLCSAVAYDHDHIARYLCKINADVNAINARGFVPLLVATGYNAHRCLRMLLFETKADYLFQTHDDWNILLHAASCGDAVTMKILAEHGLRGLDVHAKSDNLTAEDAFFSRPAAASELTLVAFRNLLAVVERNTAKMKLEEEIQTEEDTEEEVYFDTVCTLEVDDGARVKSPYGVPSPPINSCLDHRPRTSHPDGREKSGPP